MKWSVSAKIEGCGGIAVGLYDISGESGESSQQVAAHASDVAGGKLEPVQFPATQHSRTLNTSAQCYRAGQVWL